MNIAATSAWTGGLVARQRLRGRAAGPQSNTRGLFRATSTVIVRAVWKKNRHLLHLLQSRIVTPSGYVLMEEVLLFGMLSCGFIFGFLPRPFGDGWSSERCEAARRDQDHPTEDG